MRYHQNGLSMIELMIALTIGLLIMAGLANLFVQTKQSFRQDETIAHMQEEARFALNEISDDASMGGFWGSVVDGAQIENHGSIASPAPALFSDYQAAVLGEDNLTGAGNFDWATLADARPGTDALSVRRLAGRMTTGTLTAASYYLETNGTNATMVKGEDVGTPLAGYEYWEYRPAIYYIRTYCRTGDGIPSLVKHYWEAGVQKTACIAQGIENMQLEFGVDADGDGYPETYETAVDTSNADQVSTVRVFLLARATKADQEYTNNKSYTISNASSTAMDDKFYRRVYSTTVQTRNLSNLRML